MVVPVLKLNLTARAKFKLLAMSFKYVLFYTFKTGSIKLTLEALRKLHIKYLYTSNISWFGRKVLYLKGSTLAIFTNDLSNINDAAIGDLHLYLLSVNGYLVNIMNLPLSAICTQLNFYNKNYFFIIQYLIFFYRIWILFLWHVRCSLVLQLHVLAKK